MEPVARLLRPARARRGGGDRVPFQTADQHAAESLIGKPWMNADGSPPPHDGDTDAVNGLSAILAGEPPPQTPGRPLNSLVMSGGGKYGAFTAGVLVGWTAAGDRPTFDVATGISSGAV